MKPFALLLLALALLSAGCATVPLAPASPRITSGVGSDRFVTQRPASETATIFVARPGWLGTAVLLPLTLNGVAVGRLAPRTYLALDVPPGRHILALAVGDHIERQEVQAMPGQQYFYRVTVMPGAMTPLDAHDGQKAVAKSRQAHRLDQ